MGVELVLLPRVAFRGREIAGARLAGLLALLAQDLHGGCGTSRLVEGLWPQERPEHPTRALQVLVSRARAVLGAEAIVSTPAGGYRLALRDEQVDAAAVLVRAAAGARCAQDGDHAGALAQAEAGLALWEVTPGGGGGGIGGSDGMGRPDGVGASGAMGGSGTSGWPSVSGVSGVSGGPSTSGGLGTSGMSGGPGVSGGRGGPGGSSGLGGPGGFDEGADDPLAELRAARAATYRGLVRGRALALSRLERRSEAVEVLSGLIREQPQDEEVLAQLLLCEAETLGPSAALMRYDAYRRGLREGLGTDPGPELQQVHRRLLEQGAPVVRRGVEHEPNALLGRDDSLAAVRELLGTFRVVSIIGPGGLGKTRLAHAVAGGAQQRVVHLVALAGATADADVVGEVASALGVSDRGPAPVGRRGAPTDVVTGIVKALGPGPALLVLDNCEHVLAGAVELVRALVAGSEDLRVLTTSRAPLGLSSESVYLLPELSLATSIELFRQRAQAARPGLDCPPDSVRQLCSRLDGLPLAVELAAARVRVMSVAEIARRLDDRFALLRGAAHDAPQRHRTLHAVIDWSWNLLTPDTQAAMRALSIFPGGFTIDAAQHLLDVDEAEALLFAEQLVDQSLLQPGDAAGSGTRFRMLETVREFSAARRHEAGEGESVTERFLGWAREFGRAHHESILGHDVVTSAARTRDEQENLLLALRLGLEREDGTSVAAVCAVLGALWMFEADFARMAALTGQGTAALARLRPDPDFVEVARTAAVLAAVSALILRKPAVTRALVALRRLPAAPPDTPARATALVLTALVEARAEQIATLQLLCESADPLLAGMANTVAAFVWQGVNDLESALKAARRTLAAFDGQDQQLPWFRIVTHSRIGDLCLELGRGDEAHEHFAATLAALDALPGFNAFENGSSAARVRCAMVLANLQRGAVDEAEQWLNRILREDGKESVGLPMFDIAARAEIALARDEVESGLRLWRQAADALRAPGRHRDGQDTLFHEQTWTLEVEAITVIAHAQHDRLALIGQLAGLLPRNASRMITDNLRSPLSYDDSPLFGTLLLAVALLDVDRGRRTGDTRATRSGARMIALAERFPFKRAFQPTLHPAEALRLAEEADRSAYTAAVSAYAGLDADELRAAAAASVLARDQFTETPPA